jgi:hypothetical protein
LFWSAVLASSRAVVRRELESYVTQLERRHGSCCLSARVLAKGELYERSGHWAHYRDEMYPPMELCVEQMILRPMVCPRHILVFDQQPHSWRELPVRIGAVGPIRMVTPRRRGVVQGPSAALGERVGLVVARQFGFPAPRRGPRRRLVDCSPALLRQLSARSSQSASITRRGGLASPTSSLQEAFSPASSSRSRVRSEVYASASATPSAQPVRIVTSSTSIVR